MDDLPSSISVRIMTRLGLLAVAALLLGMVLWQKTPVSAQDLDPAPPPGAAAELLVTFDPASAKLKETTRECQTLLTAILESGCWVSAGNVRGHDYLLNNGSLTGGCSETQIANTQTPKTWNGTLTGSINQGNGTAAFTTTSIQTRMFANGDTADEWKAKIVLKDGRKAGDSNVYSGSAEFSASYLNYSSKINAVCTGTIQAAVEIWLPLEQTGGEPASAPKIEVVRQEDFADPASYQPFRFVVSLSRKDASGKDVRMADEMIQIENPWKTGYFQENFEASKCYHCQLGNYPGQKIFTRSQVADFPDLYLVTDQNGQASFTLYLDLMNLWYLDRLPRQKAPLKVVFSLNYSDTASGSPGKAQVVNKLFPVEVEALGIVERVFYRNPTLRDASLNETAESRRTFDLEPGKYRLGSPDDKSTDDSGIEIAGTLLGGAERVRVTHAAPAMVGAEYKGSGVILNQGDFLYTDDQVYLIAKNLPGRDVLGGYGPQINLQFRTWDGVRMVMTVGARAEQGDLLIAPRLEDGTLQKIKDAFSVITGKRKADDVWAKYKKQAGMYVFSSTCEWALKKVFPAYETVKSTGEYGSQVYTFMGYGAGDSYVVDVKSSLLVEPRPDGLYLTTRSGEPVLMTAAGQAPVPAGQTAIMAPGGKITVGATAPETAANADRILDGVPAGSPAPEVAEPGATGLGGVSAPGQSPTPTPTKTPARPLIDDSLAGGLVLLGVLLLIALFRRKK